MKNKLSIIHNQQGFFFPYVLFLAAIIILVLMTSIRIYQNEQHISHNLTEQIQIETLYQMALVSFKKDLQYHKIDQNKRYTYTFTSGFVTVRYQLMDDYIHATFDISTTDHTEAILNIAPIYFPDLVTP